MNRLQYYCVIALVLSYSMSLSARPCTIKRGDEIVRITSVVDGDTVINSRGERIRLIGINTPEKSKHKKRKNPLAEEALEYLESWVLNKRVLLEYDAERIDPHGRFLAHLHDRYGNINARMVREGYAWQAVVPPNTKYLDCYYEREQQARQEGKGVWGVSQYDAVPTKPSLLDPQLGFTRMRGIVEKVENRARSTWFLFGNRISARVKDENLEYFEGLDLAQLQGREVVLRGWVFSLKSHRVVYPSIIMEIDHPLMIENLDAMLTPELPDNVELLTY